MCFDIVTYEEYDCQHRIEANRQRVRISPVVILPFLTSNVERLTVMTVNAASASCTADNLMIVKLLVSNSK